MTHELKQFDAMLGGTKITSQQLQLLEDKICKAWAEQDEAEAKCYQAMEFSDDTLIDIRSIKLYNNVAYAKGLMDAYDLIYGATAMTNLLQKHQRILKNNCAVKAK